MNTLMRAVAVLTPSTDPQPGDDPQRIKERRKARILDFEEKGDPTGALAEAASERLLHRKLTPREKRLAGPAVHYAFGLATGALYGAVAEYSPAVTVYRGLLFSTALWMGADEIAVPALGLADPPLQQPLSNHVAMFAAHCVYGLTTETVRQQVRRAA